ncbi:MAG TPA: hypothetical protein VGR89_09310, partial [Puia sp.]|nr:hypothetical protein [Puia sp.]
MEHILDLERQQDELSAIFKKLQESNTILFLGAGASVIVNDVQGSNFSAVFQPVFHKVHAP